MQCLLCVTLVTVEMQPVLLLGAVAVLTAFRQNRKWGKSPESLRECKTCSKSERWGSMMHPLHRIRLSSACLQNLVHSSLIGMMRSIPLLCSTGHPALQHQPVMKCRTIFLHVEQHHFDHNNRKPLSTSRQNRQTPPACTAHQCRSLQRWQTRRRKQFQQCGHHCCQSYLSARPCCCSHYG